MSSINTDIAQTLDITCRRGDTLALDITFKDVSDSNATIPIDSGYEFNMEVRTSGGDNSASPILSDDNSPGTGSAGTITLNVSDAGSTGVLKVTIPDTAMANVPSGTYVYDIQAIQTVSETTTTWVKGGFTVNEDVTIG